MSASVVVGAWGFESGLNWTTYEWSQTNRRASEGALSMYCQPHLSTQYHNNMDSWMITPGPLDLSGYGKATLSFDLWLDCEPDYADYLFAGASGDDLDYYGEAFSGNSGGWVPITIDISECCGDPSVWLAFQFVSDESVVAEGAYVDNVRLDASPAVHRFYRPSTGTHFYTADSAEMQRVRSTMAGTYSYEGVAYTIDTSNPANSIPLYRFYNRKTGTHLYTADEGEKNTILATLSNVYSLDGVAYNVSMSAGMQVYRFYSPSRGVHFYSSDPTEIAYVRANLGHIWRFEGPAYLVAQ